jgi:hypothetical protein
VREKTCENKKIIRKYKKGRMEKIHHIGNIPENSDHSIERFTKFGFETKVFDVKETDGMVAFLRDGEIMLEFVTNVERTKEKNTIIRRSHVTRCL